MVKTAVIFKSFVASFNTMNKLIYTLILTLIFNNCTSKPEPEENPKLTDSIILNKTIQELNDTTIINEVHENQGSTTRAPNAFTGYESANFKLDYFHTEGYSIGDRYWYEIIIIDSLLTLYFNSPLNDDWNKIHYHKSLIIDSKQVEQVKNLLKKTNIHQKSEGIPAWSDWSGSGYGENRLYIESENLTVAGGMIYNCIGTDRDDLIGLNRTQRLESSTIGGDYETFFIELEKLFDSLPFLMTDKNIIY